MNATRQMLWLGLLGVSACTKEPVDRVAVDVYRYVDENDCYVACEINGAVEAGFAEPPGMECVDGRECTFEPGRDRVRVVVDYGPVTFQAGKPIPDTELSVIVNGVVSGDPLELQARRSDEDRGFSIADIRAPLGAKGSLRFAASVDDRLDDESMPFDLAAPKLSVRFLDCGDCDSEEVCELPAKGGQTRVLIDVPGGGSAGQVQLTDTLGGVGQAAPTSVTMPASHSGPFPFDVDIPDAQGDDWGLRVTMGDFEGASCQTVRLTRRSPVTLAVGGTTQSALDADNGTFPKRIGFEPNPACRSLTIASRSSQVSARRDAKFTASEGVVLGDVGRSVEVPYDAADDADEDQFEAFTQLVLPAAQRSQVELGVEVEDFGKVERTWYLEDLPIGGAEIFIPGSPQELDDRGTPSVSLTGFVRAPQSLRPGIAPSNFATPVFTAGTQVSLVVEVLEEFDGELECGTRVPLENLHCDRDGALSGPSGPRGGCAFTPARITVEEDGGFSTSLTSNQCFAGRVRISLWAPQVTIDPDVCVGEQLPAPGSALERLYAVELDYIAPEPEPEPEAGSDSGG